MLIRPRVTALAAVVCVLIPMTFAGSAMAHGRGHFHRHDVFRTKQAGSICAQAGVSVDGHVRGLNWYREGSSDNLSALTETQTKELAAACEKLAAAYGVKRKAIEAASKTLWEALKADRVKLDEACPALMEHHERGWWQTELSTACKEALQAYWTAAHEAGKAFQTAREEACKAFDAALTEFETATAPVVTVLDAAQTQHRFYPGQGSGGPGQDQDEPGQDQGGPGQDQGGPGQGDGGPGQGGHWHH
jgi:hypothetical protein